MQQATAHNGELASVTIEDYDADAAAIEATWEAYHQQYGEDDAQMVHVPPCPSCGALDGQWRGYRKTQKRGVIHRRRCNACGRWHS